MVASLVAGGRRPAGPRSCPWSAGCSGSRCSRAAARCCSASRRRKGRGRSWSPSRSRSTARPWASARPSSSAPADEPFVIQLTSEDPVTAQRGPVGRGADDAAVRERARRARARWVRSTSTSSRSQPATTTSSASTTPTTMTGTLTVGGGRRAARRARGAHGGGVGDRLRHRPRSICRRTRPTTITFDNADAGTTHNIAIYTDDTATDVLFDGPDVVGPDVIDYDVPAIDAGRLLLPLRHPPADGGDGRRRAGKERRAASAGADRRPRRSRGAAPPDAEGG